MLVLFICVTRLASKEYSNHKKNKSGSRSG